MATIQDLPVELLLTIFQHVYPFLSSMDPTPKTKAHQSSAYRLSKDRACRYRRSVKHGPSDGEIMALKYPVTSLSVCRLWRNILQANLIQFYVDEYSPAYIEQFESQIRQANVEFALDIRVINRRADDTDKHEEKQIAQDVMKIISPILYRCRTLVFKLLYGSSLPVISQDFSGNAPDLLLLKLQCRIREDEITTPVKGPIIGPDLFARSQDRFTTPNLTILALDGLTFADAFLIPSWVAQMANLSLDKLSISHCGPSHTLYNAFDVYFLLDSLSSIAHIRHLILDDIGIETTHEILFAGHPHPRYHLKVDHLTITRPQKASVVRQFLLRSVWPVLDYFHLSQAPIDHRSIPAVHHLRLEEAHISGYFWHGFMTTLNRFYGHRLDLIKCEALCDQHLLQIGTHCERMFRLYIKDCPNITVGGLKAMIIARNDNIQDEHQEEADTDNDEYLMPVDESSVIERAFGRYFSGARDIPFVPIHRLHISGHPCVLSQADKRWFRKHVREFCWV